MIKLAIDAMGGDFAPTEIVKGINLAINRFDDVKFVVYGDKEKISKDLIKSDRIEIIDAPKFLNMGEKDPINTIRKNRDLSMVQAFQAVHDKECDGAVTAGPTQGAIVAAHLIVRRLKGMKRVALCPALPVVAGKSRLLLDVGANTDIRPEHILQHAHFASVYLSKTRNIERPLIGLINIGTEPGKGREQEKEVFNLLTNNDNINFYGNVEPKELFTTPCDILVTDGFSGNLVMKTTEGTGKAVGIILKEEIKSSLAGKIGYLFMKKNLERFKKRMSADEVGGAIIFGVDGVIVKAHGSSDGYAFMMAINQARNAVSSDFINIMRDSLEETNDEE